MTTVATARRLIEQARIKDGQGDDRAALRLLRRAALDPAVRADAFFWEASILRERDIDYERALDLFRRSAAEQTDPWKRSDALRASGKVLVLLGRPDEAIQALKAARAALPVRSKEPRSAIYDVMSRAHEAAGRTRKALLCHRLAWVHHRHDPETMADHMVRTVRLAEKLGDYDRLLACLGRLLERDPDRIPIDRGLAEARDASVQERLGRLLRGLSEVLERTEEDPDAPATSLGRQAVLFRGIVFYLLGRDREARECAELVLETEDPFYAHHVLGKVALRKHRTPEAREHLERARERRGEPYADLLRDLAEVYRRLEEWAEAIEALEALAELEEDEAHETRMTIARLEESRGDREASYRILRRLADEGAEGVRRDRLGAMACSLGHHEEAIRDLTRAITSRPDEAVYILRGRAFEETGRYRRALEDYGRALDLVGDRRDIFWREATVRRANVLIRYLDRHQEGLDLIEPILEREPGEEEALLLKGDGLKGLQRYSESVACYAEAVDRRIGERLLEEGRDLLDDGEVDEALRCYNEAFNKRPSWEVYYAAAAAYARLERADEAARFIARAAEQNPSALRFAWRDRDFEAMRETEAFQELVGGEEAST